MNNDLTLNLRIRVSNDGTAHALGQTGDNIDRVDRSARRAGDGLRVMDSAAASVTRTLASFAGAYSLYNLAEKIIRDTAAVQDLDTRLHTLTKTAGDYAQSVAYIDTVADKQHKKINDLADSYAKLRNLQNSGLITSQRTKEFFEGMNDAASALGVGNDQLKQTFFGLSQSLGLLNAENFNQVMEPIPGLLQEMDKAARLPAGGFKNLVNEGEATAAFFSDTLAKALHTFDGAAAATANNINAKSTDISNSWTRLITKMEEPISVNLNPVLDDINSLLKAAAELNGSALIEGIITLGEIGVTVFAGKLVVSIGAYLVAKYNAITAEMAHAAALTMDLERTVALTSAELANTSATVASMQATLANTTAMGARMAVANQLNIALLAQAQAQAAATAAMAAQSAAAVTFSNSLKMLLNPINLVNVGLAGLVGWEIGKWLNSFETVRITATATLGAILQGLENVSYYWDRLQIALSKGSNKDARLAMLKEGHLAAKKAIDDNIVSTIAYELNGRKASESANQLATSQNSVAVAAGQSSKEIKEVIKDLEQQIKYQAELAKATNAGIDAQIKDLDRLTSARTASLDAERKANDFAYEQHKLSAQAYLDMELALIDKATQAKVEALNQQAALQKNKLDEQVTDVDKAYEAIRQIESRNQAGQVNKSTFALGQGQVLPSTLANPGFGMSAYADSAAIDKIKGDYSALVDYVKAHETELANWGKSYFEHLTVYYKSIPEAVKHYGDGTDAYMAKFMQHVGLINGSTINQIKLAGEQKDIEAEIAKVVAEGQAQKTAAMQKSITESQTYIHALEDERVKLLELTGEATKAREAKAALALERNPAYRQAVASGNTADAKVFTDANTAEKLNAATAAANAYQDRLDAINKSTKDIGITSTEAFDVINKGFGGLVGTFNSLTDSIDKATNALVDNAKQARDAANDKSLDPKQRADLAVAYADKEKALEADRVKTAVAGTRQIASAFSQMLDKNSKEYKAAHAIEMALAGAELAMQIMKITGIGMVTAAEVASIPPLVAASELKTTAKFGETWATEQQLFAISSVMAAEAASVGPSVASSTVKAEAKAVEAVATQASAGPYIGFALMAAMAVAMAGLGLMSGKGAAKSPGPQGMSPDTGTVLGDSSAKSQSVDKTYQLLKDIQAQNYPVLKSIDKGISDLHYGITDVITRLYQAGGLTPVNAPATTMTGILPVLNSIDPGHILRDIDPIGSAIMGALFGGKQSSTVVSQGIAIDPTTLNDIINKKNLNARQFAQIETKTDGGWFGSDSFSFSNQYSELDSKTQKALNSVFKSMGDTMLGLADNLGLGLSDRVKDYVIPSLMINLQGLNGEDAAKKLSGILSTTLDTMSEDIFGKITGDYQKLGEGMLETTTRVVTQVAIVNDALSSVGSKLSGDMVSQLKVADDAVYKFGGGGQVFQKNFESGFDKFASPEAKQSRLLGQIKSQFDGIFTADQISTLTKSREEYGKLFAALDQTNPLYAQQVASMVNLAEKSDNYYKGVEESASKTRALQISLLEAQGQSELALSMTRQDAVKGMSEQDAALQGQIWSTQDLIKTQSLNAQLMELTGNITEAVAFKRNQELAALSDTDKAIQKKIYRQQDEAETVALEIQLLEAESRIRGNEAKLLDATRAKREQELAATDKLLVALKKQLYITQDLATATEKLQAAMKKSVDLNVQLLNELGRSYDAEQLSRSQTLQELQADLTTAQTTVADAVTSLTTAADNLSAVTQTLGKSVATTGNYAGYSDADIKKYIKDFNLTSVEELVGAATKYNVNPLQVGAVYGLTPGETAATVQRVGATLTPAPYTDYTPEQIRQYVTDAGLTAVKDIFAATQKFNADPYKVGAAYGLDKAATSSALKDAGINLVDIPGFTELLVNQTDLTAQVGGLTKAVDTGNKTVSTIQGAINTQQAIFDAKDAKIKAGLDIELMNAQGRAYDALAATRQNELKALSPANQELKKQIYTLQDAAKSRALEIELLNAQGLSYQALIKTREDELKGLSDSDAAIKRSTYAAQDAAKTRGVEIELLNAQGLSYQALIKTREDELKSLSDTDATIKRSTYAAQDAAKTRGLEIELLNLSGDSVKALAMTREDELQGLSSTDQAIKKHIYAAQDLEKTHSLEIELLNAQKKATQSLAMTRADELAGLSATDAMLKRQTYAMQDAATLTTTAFAVLQKSVEADRKSITDSYNAGIKTTQDSIDALTASTDKLKGLSSALKGYLDKLQIPGNEAIDRASAQSQITAAIMIARTGGVGAINNQDSLIKAVDVLGRPSQDLFKTFLDYQNDFVRTANDIATLSELTDAGLSTSDRQLKALQTGLDNDKKLYDAEMARLDSVLSSAQAQIDAVNGTTIAVMSVKDAVAGLSVALSLQAELQKQVPVVSGASPAVSAFTAFTPDIKANLLASVPVFDAGTISTLASAFGYNPADLAAAYGIDGSHATGLDYVPFDGYRAELHKGERVLTANENQSWSQRQFTSSSGNNAELVEEIRALRVAFDRQQKIIEKQQEALDKIETNTQNTATHTKDTETTLRLATNSDRTALKTEAV